MTLRQLFWMATAKREAMRTHALDIATTVSAMFDAKKKTNWEQFIKTGSTQHIEPLKIRGNETPLIAASIDRIRRNKGRFILESN